MLRIAIVVSKFNFDITKRMLEKAEKTAGEKGIEIVKIVQVSGAYDMALPVSKIVKKEEVQAVVCLGAIVKGETKHDEIIATALAQNLQRISVENAKPVLFGIIGPGATYSQATCRAEEYGERCILGAIEMVEEMRSI